ncbi:hypothetical protein JTB14_006383 [Gonioctena quinquepunctata]|nr:hypothetical protein JTB14_006383 [Gonioctena quinquepunctata]
MCSRKVRLADLKVAKLKQELEERKLETTGKKQVLQERLAEGLIQEENAKNLEEKLQENSRSLEENARSLEEKFLENTEGLKKELCGVAKFLEERMGTVETEIDKIREQMNTEVDKIKETISALARALEFEAAKQCCKTQSKVQTIEEDSPEPANLEAAIRKVMKEVLPEKRQIRCRNCGKIGHVVANVQHSSTPMQEN